MKTLDIQKAITCSHTKAIVFGVTLTFPQTFKTGSEAHRFFQTTYFDQLGADGLCRLVAQARTDLFSLDYWLREPGTETKLAGLHGQYVSKDHKKSCLRIENGNSYMDILLGNTHPGAYQSEADFMTKELNTYKDEGFILEWKQFTIV